jgi:hypothetical protein
VQTILARVLIHVPEPSKHLVHFYDAYANRVRSSLALRLPRVSLCASHRAHAFQAPPQARFRSPWTALANSRACLREATSCRIAG